MANNYEQYSAWISCANDEQQDWLIAALNAHSEVEPDMGIGSFSKEAEGVWLYVEEYCEDMEALTAIIQNFLVKFDLDTRLVISVAYTCSNLRIDAFGGWAVGISKDKIVWIHPEELARKALEE